MSLETPDDLETRVVPLQLPSQVPRQTYRPAQSNIPDDKHVRVRLKAITEAYLARVGAIPPLTLDELVEHTGAVLAEAGLDPIYRDYASILVSNTAWRESLAQIPYDRRLLLIPKCLRVEDKCPAPFDEFGLLCKECGLCSIQDLTVEAERLGYAVLVAEGSAIVRSMIETGKIEAIVGVSCINVLEKCFPHMEAAAIPGVAIPLLQDDCVNTTVDLDWVWDLIHLTSDDKTYRLDLDALKTTVRGWFSAASLRDIMGDVEDDDETARIARDYLEKGGKRWRPYLATCTYMALESDRQDEEPRLTAEVKKAAIAIECFHKASLVHDDIEDGDDQRYEAPALHTEVGVPVALNVGDFLVGEGYRLLAELGNAQLIAVAAHGHVTLSRGQGRELLWARDPKPLASLEVLDIFRQKTAGGLRGGAAPGRNSRRRERGHARRPPEVQRVARDRLPDQGRPRRLQGRSRFQRPRAGTPVAHPRHRAQACGRGRSGSDRGGHPGRGAGTAGRSPPHRERLRRPRQDRRPPGSLQGGGNPVAALPVEPDPQRADAPYRRQNLRRDTDRGPLQ